MHDCVTLQVTTPTSWLPCLRHRSDRWWLPCDPATFDVLSLVILSHHLQGDDSTLQCRIIERLQRDPAFLVYASLACPYEHVDDFVLAEWIQSNLVSQFTCGDAFLGLPEVSTDLLKQWRKLRDHFATVPRRLWIDDAALWLEATGPSIPDSWRQEWPTADFQEQEIPHQGESNTLQLLARRVEHLNTLERAFATKLNHSKQESLIQLAYGLSHEINNPLANISTRAQQLQRGEEDEARVATLQRIVDQVYRAHHMISDLMFYANPPEPQKHSFDLVESAKQVVGEYQDEATRQSIRMEFLASTPKGHIEADENMVIEAIRVVIRNSLEAVGCQGTIEVSVSEDDDFLKIQVADSGPGVSDQAHRHAFDPYFSGREAGRGLGLGLCRAYRIATLHGGEISLSGGPVGCVACLRLPRKSTH